MAALRLPPALAALAAEVPAAGPALADAYYELVHEREDAVAFLAAMEARRAEADDSDGPKHHVVGWELHEKMMGGRSTKVLEAWAQQRERWERVKARLTTVSGKPTTGLAMERGDEARRRVEALALVELASPLEERFGPLAWALSLRDNWQMFVPIGHPLISGISGVRRVDKQAEHGIAAVRRTETTEPTTARGQKAAAAFERNTRTALRRRGAAAGAAAGGAVSGVGAMEVRGQGLEPYLRALITRDITPEETLRALGRLNPDAATALREAHAAKEALEEVLAAESAAAAAPVAVARGPALSVEPTMLSFRGTAPDAAAMEADAAIVAAGGVAPVRGSRGVVTLRNTGTTALFYRWVLADTAGDPGAQPQFAQLPYSGPRPGMLLPGESRRTAFRFAPTRAGAASELWAVQCAPDLAQGPGEAVPMVMLQGSARMTQSAAAAAAVAAAAAAAQRAREEEIGAAAAAEQAAAAAALAAEIAKRRTRMRAAAAVFDDRMASAQLLLRAGALGRRKSKSLAPGAAAALRLSGGMSTGRRTK